MTYVSQEEIELARQMDLQTWLERNDPYELVYLYPGHYTTRTHDSLKIDHGSWFWWSQGFGGRTALDYLVMVRGIPFAEAVQMILQESGNVPEPRKKEPVRKAARLLLPGRNTDNESVVRYLTHRGISEEIVRECIRRDLLYEAAGNHSCVFVGYDSEGKVRYGFYRATSKERFMKDASGSDKAYAFCINALGSREIHVFESAIDLLSYATIRDMDLLKWDAENMLSLSGVYVGRSNIVPAALRTALKNDPNIEKVCLHLDNDKPGRSAAEWIKSNLEGRYQVTDEPPEIGKDYNDYLMYLRGKEIGNKWKQI